MDQNIEPQEEKERVQAIEYLLRLEGQAKSGAGWFFWIAILSLINSLISLFGGSWNFLIGLGITQFIDGMAMAVAEESAAETAMVAKLFAFFLNLIVAAIFILFGVLSRKGKKVPFVIGMVLYSLDGLLFLAVGDYLSFGFHLFVLYWLYRGFKAVKQLTLIQQSIQNSSAEAIHEAG